jgi:hypothetical protein
MPSLSDSFKALADKALSATPLAGRLSNTPQERLDVASSPPPAGGQPQGDRKTHTMESIQHYLRTLGQQYSFVTSSF